jgi:hypothetical protein
MLWTAIGHYLLTHIFVINQGLGKRTQLTRNYSRVNELHVMITWSDSICGYKSERCELCCEVTTTLQRVQAVLAFGLEVDSEVGLASGGGLRLAD